MRTCKNCKYEYETALSTALGARKYFCSSECYTVWVEGLVYDPTITRTPEEEHLLGVRKCAPKDRDDLDEKHRKTSCGRFTLRGANKHEAVFMRGNCKCWNCPRCGPKKAGRYKHAIRKNAEKFKLRRFLTLTLDPKTLPKGVDPVEHLRASFNKLRTYLRRKFGEKISYICVLEFQKPKANNPGLPHLHILVDRYIEQAWIKHAWSTLGGGEHVDIRVVDLHRVSRYLSKYLTKEMLVDAPSKSRRVTTSRNISLTEKKASDYRWLKINTTIAELKKRYESRCIDVELDSDNEILRFSISYRITGGWEPKQRVVFSGSGFEFICR